MTSPTAGGRARTTRRTFVARTGAASALLALGGLARPWSAWADADATSAGSLSKPPRSADLRETGDLQRRWMSLSGSRLVVNPFDFNTSLRPAEYNNGSHLPLHVGYYAAARAHRLLDTLMLYRKPEGRTGGLDVAWADEFESLSEDWIADPDLEATVSDGQLRLNLSADASNWWGSVQRWVEVDLDESPYIEVSITELADAWALRVNDGGADITIQGDTNDQGQFTYDLRKLTGWRGTKRFRVRLVVAVWEKPAKFDYVRIVGVRSAVEDAQSFETAWLPHELPATAEYESGASVELHDYFADENTLLRSLSFDLADPTDLGWLIGGRYKGDVSWDGSARVLTVAADAYTYAVALPDASSGKLEYYPRLVDFLSDTGAVDSPGSEGYWAVELTAASDGPLPIALGFATSQEGADVAVGRATATARRGDWTILRAMQERSWTRYLQCQVPHPAVFDLVAAPAGCPREGCPEVTPDQVRDTYYKAWIFAAANVLPPMPEVDFPYPQLATGKPSMWAFGAPQASASATWESMLQIQFYGYADPAVAWNAFRGLMSLVDETGALAGEVLPTRAAQTAMVLYHLSGDQNRLRDIYPSLKRHLIWKKDNPRWIHGDHDNPHEKDAGFVVSVLIDMKYARDIADILEFDEDIEFWESQRREYFNEYLAWFWETPDSEPVEYYYTDTGARNRGGTLWITSGLHLDLWNDNSQRQLDGLKRRFTAEFKPQEPFGNFAYPKYSDISYTIYGLLDQGMHGEALQLANVAVRDTTRANMFAEVYFEWEFPEPRGVRPSFFGAGFAMDMVMMNNGYRMDQGWPHLVRFHSGEGGVSNLRLRGRTLNLRVEPESGTVRCGGSLVREIPDCREVAVAVGETVPLPLSCGSAAF
ncbi:hypothetical protein [Actinopolymorpha sp. B9G3]|uniref:hypothetical protein n=1 Tax=Actinopolymorpha sp. B9G3 TaxID=3158970 RepID=UPI0032D8BF07